MQEKSSTAVPFFFLWIIGPTTCLGHPKDPETTLTDEGKCNIYLMMTCTMVFVYAQWPATQTSHPLRNSGMLAMRATQPKSNALKDGPNADVASLVVFTVSTAYPYAQPNTGVQQIALRAAFQAPSIRRPTTAMPIALRISTIHRCLHHLRLPQ